jgi:hypothetical protein
MQYPNEDYRHERCKPIYETNSFQNGGYSNSGVIIDEK